MMNEREIARVPWTAHPCGEQRDIRMLMLAPHPSVRGPLTKHTPVLVEALKSIGCSVVVEPWGQHHDHESTDREGHRAVAGHPADKTAA